MQAHFGRGRQPPWWPHGEPWPPRHIGRRRFGRRILFGALLVIVLSVTGTVTLAQLIAQALGLADVTGGGAAAILLTSAIVGIGLIALAMAGLTRRVAVPLGGVMDAADRVAAGNYDVQVAERGSPPIRGLARAFNAMTSRLRDHDRLRRDLMADIAHELRTPLRSCKAGSKDWSTVSTRETRPRCGSCSTRRTSCRVSSMIYGRWPCPRAAP